MKFVTRLKPSCDGLIDVRESCERVAKNVLSELARLDKSPAWLADQIGVYRSRMTKVLDDNDPQLINVNTLANLAIALNVSMDWLHRPIIVKTKQRRRSAT